MRRSPLLGLLLATTVLLSRPAVAAADPAHAEPQGPAPSHFPADFPRLVDHEWDFPLGGFGGTRAGAPRSHAPVIFVHGNTVDAADWFVVRDDFKAAGWTDQELFALSYNGLGGNSGTAFTRLQPERDVEHLGWDGEVRVTNNTVNAHDLRDFIHAVRTYTGSARFSIVAHSLGVTVARKVLQTDRALRKDLVAFVGIAGGNHGTSLCPPGSEGNVVSCDEIAAGTAWLADLNGPDGADETYGATRWLTVYDGSGAADPGYAATYAQSPVLKGADNREFPGTYHNDLRISRPIVKAYREFVESADAAATDAAAAPVAATTTTAPPAASAGNATAKPRAALPATGTPADGGPMLAAVLLALTLLARLRNHKTPPKPVARAN